MVPHAYEGKENYIFVSYAHADRKEVFKLLSEFEQKGYRFWYDDGIAPGSEWPEDIAQHLNNSYVVMAIITPCSVKSLNCRREINYSLAQNKHFLSVFLEKTEMSAGLEMQLSSQQSVLRYNYTSHEAFINKILNSPFILPCKQEIIEEPEKPAGVSSKAKEDAEPVEEPLSAKKDAAEKKAAKAAASKAKAEKGAASKVKAEIGSMRKPLIILALAAVLILIITLSYNSKVTTSWGEKYEKDLHTIYVDSVVIQQSDIDKFCKIRKPNSLHFKDCDLSECDLSPLVKKLYSRALLGSSIHLDGCTGIKDFSILSDTDADSISLAGISEFTDLSVLPLDNLRYLNISGTGVEDISLLKDAANLYSLDISNTGVTDISAISSLEKLTSLNISNCKISDLKSIFKSHKLEELYASGCGISDLSAFSICNMLEELDISKNPDVKDMSWLNSQNSKTLKILNVGETGLDSAAISGLSDYNALTQVNVDGIALEDLNFLKGATDVEFLSAQGCGLKDISGLKGCHILKTVLLSFNKITDIGGLTSLQPGDDPDIKLDLSFNSLKDISKLPEGSYHTLLLAGNDQSLASTLPAGIKAHNLSIDWYDGIFTSSFAGTSNFDHVYITGTPDSEKKSIEENLTETRTDSLTMDELYTEYLTKDKLSYKTYIDYSYAVKLYKNR